MQMITHTLENSQLEMFFKEHTHIKKIILKRKIMRNSVKTYHNMKMYLTLLL